MTTCTKILPQLTAYLDGELADENGSVVRGHLRECAACRQAARDEAALRDGLRMLAPVQPPASLWAGVQAQLAAAEVADARQPRWRRAARRWARWIPAAPSLRQLAVGGAIAAAAAGMLTWRARPTGEPPGPIVVSPPPVHDDRPVPLKGPDLAEDVTAELRAEPAQTTESYGQVIEELMKLSSSVRAAWSDEQQTEFDARVAALQGGIARAASGRAQQRAQRTLIRYLQAAVVRDDVVLASGVSP